MTKAMEITQAIEGNVEKLKNQPNFIDWVVKQPAEKGDIVLINNSFIFSWTLSICTFQVE